LHSASEEERNRQAQKVTSYLTSGGSLYPPPEGPLNITRGVRQTIFRLRKCLSWTRVILRWKRMTN